MQKMRRKRYVKRFGTAAAAAAVALGVFTALVNTSPAFAASLSGVPVLGGLVKVVTFREYTVKENRFDADVKVPAIQGLENETLQSSLNEKYLEEDKQLYEQFTKEMDQLKKASGGNIGVSSDYEVLTDNDTILSICRWQTKIAADSYTVRKFDTIDKTKQVLLTLPSLFRDDSYIKVISENIIGQMKEQAAQDEGKVYWLDDGDPTDAFRQIDENQSFYINGDGKLVICFDQFVVGPGYMGTPEFVIPTDVLSDILVGDEYIK